MFYRITVAALVTGSLCTVRVTLPQWLWYISLGFAAYHVLCMLVLELHTRLISGKSSPDYLQPKISTVNVSESGDHDNVGYEAETEGNGVDYDCPSPAQLALCVAVHYAAF